MSTTARHAYPVPDGGDAVQIPVDMKALADAIDAQTPYRSTTQPPALDGLVWYNPTTGLALISDGTSFLPMGPLGRVASTTNAAQNDYGSTETVVISVTPTLTAGRRYRISAALQGTQITASATGLFSKLLQGAVGGTELGRPFTGVTLSTNQTWSGSTFAEFLPTTSGPQQFSLSVIDQGGGAFRIPLGNARLVVEDIGVQ